MSEINYSKLLAKLDRPPSGPNWVRFVHNDIPQTTKSILSFVKGTPHFTYSPAYTAIRDRIQLGINLETAIKVAQRSGAPAGRKQNEELIKSFFSHADNRQYAANSSIGFEKEWFLVSREVKVPVSPLSIIREKGQFVPLFVCGWSKINLTNFQRRLLVTIYEDAFLSLTDYQTSPAEFMFFPKNIDSEEEIRCAEIWQRGDYELLSYSSLNEAVNIFLAAREIAKNILLLEMKMAMEKKKTEHDTTEKQEYVYDLFSKT